MRLSVHLLLETADLPNLHEIDGRLFAVGAYQALAAAASA